MRFSNSVQLPVNFVMTNFPVEQLHTICKNVGVTYIGANLPHSVVNFKCVGNRMEVEKHEECNHTDLMIKVLLTLQAEQASNASMISRSCSELKSLRAVISQLAMLKEKEETYSRGTDNACQDCNRSEMHKECAIKLKIVHGIKETLDQQSKKLKKLERTLDFVSDELTSTANTDRCQNDQAFKRIDRTMAEDKDRFEHMYKKMEKSIDLMKEKLCHFEEYVSKNIETITKKQTAQCEKLECIEENVMTELKANHELADSLIKGKKVLNDKIDTVSIKQDNMKCEMTRIKGDIECEMKKQLDLRFKSFQYIWKVEKFAHYQQTAKTCNQTTIYSQPFYSSEFGYKMRLQICPNGDGIGEGSHLSFFLQVLQGPNDEVLNWPIQFTALFSVLDQSYKKDHFFAEFHSDPCEFKECYEKPICEHNLACGFPTFICLDKLKKCYLVDDTIFFKVEFKINS
uniref:MATH domain-containing protein n=1 Tax=Strigamia maritima TaxID=126957 RepID=T1IZU4_STRMM